MINLEVPKKIKPLVSQAHQVAQEMFRPISRKYDTAEHEYPKELDTLAALMAGMDEGGGTSGAGAAAGRKETPSPNGNGKKPEGNRNGANMATALGAAELCWGDVGLLLSMPNQGLGNSAIAAVADDEQLERYGGKWASMAITEPEAGSDSAAIRTTATRDGDEWVLNGEKIYVTSGERCELVVVWATLDKSKGRAAIRSFVVERSNPGMVLDRLEHKLGIRASDTAAFTLQDCRVPMEALLGSPDVDTDTGKGFAGAMQTFDNTRPLVAAMALGVAKASLDFTQDVLKKAGVVVDDDAPWQVQPAAAAELIALEADYEAARLMTLTATWMADNSKPNSLQASMAKAKAGRSCVDIALRCIELCGSVGYAETELLEKWARDGKILDIFEGTQQIQLLIIARQLLKKSSAELR